MTAKNMAIREEVFRKLVDAKMEGESFSDVIERLIERRGSLLPLWGSLSGKRELKIIEQEIKAVRKRAVIRG